MKFVPCNGNCTEDDVNCVGCGRTLEEIEAMRKPVKALASLAQKMGYENIDDFANAVADSVKYQLGPGH